MIQIPYKAIGYVLSLMMLLGAFNIATYKWRIFLSSAFLLLFVLPFIWTPPIHDIVIFIGRLMLGIISYLYLRWHSHSSRI